MKNIVKKAWVTIGAILASFLWVAIAQAQITPPTPPAATTPGTPLNSIQFNSGGTFTGDTKFTITSTWASTTDLYVNALYNSTVSNNASAGAVIVNGSSLPTTNLPSVPHPFSIHIIGPDTGGFPALYIDNFASGLARTYRPIINLRNANGTPSAPASTTQGDELGRISGRGYNGTAFTGSVSSVSFFAAENYTSTAQGAGIDIRTTALGTSGGGSEQTPPVMDSFMPSGALVIGSNTFNHGASGLLALDPGQGVIVGQYGIGVGTTTGMGSTTGTYQLLIASTTVQTVNNFAVDNAGNQYGGGGTPAVACASACTLDTNAHDSSGTIFISGVQTSVTLTFYQRPKPWAPHCTASDNVTTGVFNASSTLNTVVFSTTASLGTASISYTCWQ